MNRLVQRACAGDIDAFGELFDCYREAIYRVCCHYVNDADVARDLVQDTFLTAFERLRQLRNPGKFAAWLHRIAQNVCISWIRRQRTQTHALETMQATVSDGSPADIDWSRLELHDAIHQALSQLPEDERTAITMFYVDGYSHKEIVDLLRVPVSTVKGRLHRGRRHLRHHLQSSDMAWAHGSEAEPFAKEVSTMGKWQERILISDDEPHVVRLLMFNLCSRGGYDALGTTWAQQTIELARSWQPKLIITDLHKGRRLEGFRIIRALKADKQTAHIPILVVSAHAAKPQHSRRALACGADRVIAKPFDPRQLLEIVGEMVKPKRKGKQLPPER